MIVFVNRFAPPDIAATAQLIGDLARSLAEYRDVVVVSGRQQYSTSPGVSRAAHVGSRSLEPARDATGPDSIHAAAAGGVRFVRLGTSRFGRARMLGRALDYLSFHLVSGWWLWRNLRRGDVVVALTDPPLISVVAGVAARMRGAALVNWVQDLFPEVAIELGEPRAAKAIGRPLRSLRDWSLRAAAANVAIGTRMAESMGARGIPAARVRTIHNWAHEEAARVDAAPPRGRPGHAPAFVVMYAGNLGRAHDAGVLLGAAVCLRDRVDIEFVIVGGGHGNSWLRVEAQALALPNIRFEDYAPLDRLGELLAMGDLHVVSLRPELEGLIMPSKFYGIAAAARPVAFVGDPDGELASIITGADCGFVVPVGDGEALARGITDLSDRPEYAREMGRRARSLVERQFSRCAALQSWTNLLDDVHVPRNSTATPNLERSNRES